MLRLLFAILSISFSLHATEVAERDPISIRSSLASLSGLPSTLVNNHVCAITGEFVDTQTDVALAGPEPLVLRRCYSNGHNALSHRLKDGWSFDIPANARVVEVPKKMGDGFEVYVEEHFGSSLLYSGKKLSKLKFEKPKGLTNCLGEISGKTNFKNQSIEFGHSEFDVTSPAGDVRHYKFLGILTHFVNLYRITQERTASGHLIHYKENKIVATDLSGKTEYGWIQFSSLPDHGISVKTSTEREIQYTFRKHKRDELECYYLSAVKRSDRPEERYLYKKKNNNPNFLQIERKIRGDKQFVAVDYYASGRNNVGLAEVELKKKSDFIDRVMVLAEPVGSDLTPIVTYRFFYEPNITNVYDAYNHRTAYRFDARDRLTAHEKYMGVYGATTLYSRENYEWGNDDNLIGSYQHDGKCIRSGQWFTYDDCGNILTHKLYGCLTGKQDLPIVLGKDKRPTENGCESYTKTFTYSDDKYHNLLSEQEENGRTIKYAYEPDTDRIVAKFLVYEKQIRLRQFFTYNACGVITETIKDDGCSDDKNNLTRVTERHITRVKPSLVAPVGVPELTEEFYLDLKTNREILLKRMCARFSREGRMTQQDHYDADGAYRYSLRWEYDQHGNVIKETNALNQTTVRKYDSSDNLLYEQVQDTHTDYEYDAQNRLIRVLETHSDGNCFATNHSYNYLNQKVLTVDSYGNKTQYTYDDLGRLIKTIGPLNDTQQWKYDVYNNRISATDARGYTTYTSYTLRKQPILTTFPDGSTECNEYNRDGSLSKKVAKNGTITLFSYDYQGRIVSEETYAQGQLLSRKNSTYNALHLLSETDARGTITTYEYDGAGRLCAIKKGERCTRFEYDKLGRKYKTIECLDHGTRVLELEYDCLNRVIAEKVADGQILTSYCYDHYGNRTHEIKQTHTGQSITQTEYNSLKMPVEIVDALKNRTHISYDFYFTNAEGKQVLQTTTTDPLGNQTIHTYDPLFRVVSTIRKDRMGVTLSQIEQQYDSVGNCTQTLAKVIVEEKVKAEIATQWNYNAANQVTRQIEAVGTPEQRITEYVYNSFGQKAAIIKPDGTHLSHEYDAQGLLKALSSSDRSISYAYTYDGNHNVVQVKDQTSTTLRTYNIYNEVTLETLNNGLTLTFAYDKIGRVKRVTLPDASAITYEYDTAFLRSVKRLSSTGSERYAHHYLEYDQRGALRKSQLPGAAGFLEYQHDLMGRVTESKATHQTQSVFYDAVGNIRNITDDNPVEYSYDSLYQLTSETGHTYAFDSLHNRIAKDGNPYQFNALNQLLKQTDTTYRYDANGNLIQKADGDRVVTYRYDALDRLIESNNGTKTTYTYDAFNRRVSKSNELYLYQGQNEIGSLVDNKTVSLRLLGNGKGAEIGAAIALELASTPHVPLHDVQGNVSALLDLSGNVIEKYRYTAFGEEQIFDAAGQIKEDSCNPWRFASKRHDSETGFVYYGRRYYAPDVGRWVTSDPIGFADGPNLYAYVRNNPLTLFDLYGLAVGDAYRDSVHVASNINHYLTEPNSRDRKNLCQRCSTSLQQQMGARVQRGVFFDSFDQESYIKDYPGKEYADLAICTINGVNVTDSENDEGIGHLQKLTGGAKIRAVYNATHGFIVDLFECVLGLFGVSTRPVRLLHEVWYDFFLHASPYAKILQYCHSQGAIHLRNALASFPEHLRNRILVVAIAPAAYISEKLCGGVRHYRAPWYRDFVPQIDLFGKWGSKATTVLNSHPDASWFDHGFCSKTYEEVIHRHAKRYIKNNGEGF